eukprot:scaffold1954_cov268-Pinguiococcus_pyrenoidosus.AAC.181
MCAVEEFRSSIGAKLEGGAEGEKEAFLDRCYYIAGQYDSEDSFKTVAERLTEWEGGQGEQIAPSRRGLVRSRGAGPKANRLYYFAIPPNVFLASATAIKAQGLSPSGWTRLIVEKPFGHDLESATALADNMNAIFTEEYLYRIDHYLGKEMVQNTLVLRFANAWLEPLMNRNHVASITVTFKENFGTQGRGGYFDKYGIIRDIMQNHLMQVVSLITMEAPSAVAGDLASAAIRNAKVAVLKCMEEVDLAHVVTGQYVADDKGNEGYLDDETVPDDSVTPTYCAALLKVMCRSFDLVLGRTPYLDGPRTWMDPVLGWTPYLDGPRT